MHGARAGNVIKPSFPVVVTSYEIVIADVKFLQKYKWKYIVVDEGHRLKNSNCKLLRELRSIPTANKLLLSGQALCLCACLLRALQLPACLVSHHTLLILCASCDMHLRMLHPRQC